MATASTTCWMRSWRSFRRKINTNPPQRTLRNHRERIGSRHEVEAPDGDLTTTDDQRPTTDSPPTEVKVAIIGHPNVGKSTLLNQLTGTSRAIVSPIPGTTRDAVDEIVERDGTAISLHRHGGHPPQGQDAPDGREAFRRHVAQTSRSRRHRAARDRRDRRRQRARRHHRRLRA